MSRLDNDSCLKEVEQNIGKQRKEGEFYIVNTTVPKDDHARVLGPFTKDQLEEKRKRYGQHIGMNNPEEHETNPFRAYQCIKQGFKRVY